VRRRAIAGALVVVLLFAARPVERRLVAQSRPVPEANRLGVGQLMGGVLTGAFRPLLSTYLSIRGDILYGEGRYDELQIAYRTMLRLNPDNEKVRTYVGFNLAFNLKSEAPTQATAWTWARDGLDILVELPAAKRQVADWVLKQCGQNPFRLMRYAGPRWARERAWRERLSLWAEQRLGRALPRFEVGLAVLAGEERFFDQLRRVNLLLYQVLDDWMRTGHSEHVDEAVNLCQWMSQQAPDLEAFRDHFAGEAWMLRELEQGRVTQRLLDMQRYEVAAALWGLGAHGNDEALLEGALRALDAFEEQGVAACPEERQLIAAWLAHVREPSTPRPPLPFDS